MTKAYDLPARFVIHTVGPVWHGGSAKEEELLASCYHNCLEIAKSKRIKTIAFPSISTGAYRFPIEKAAEIALRTVNDFVLANPDILDKVVFVLFSDADLNIYRNLLK